MQFSVIVEGAMENSPSDEELILELERFLLASDIPPSVLKNLKSGQSHVLKNQLTYEQAVKISDRLMDLGLDSIIDPPIKPDDDDIPSGKQKTATQALTNSQSGNTAAAKSAKLKAVKPPSKQTGAASKPRAKQSKPALAVVKTQSNNAAKRQQRPLPKMAAVDVNNTHASIHQTSKPTRPITATLKDSASTAQTIKKKVNAQAQTKTANHTASKSSPLTEAAAEVKALFNLPKQGKFELPLTKSARINMVIGAVVSLLVPSVYLTFWLTLLFVSASASYSLLATGSIGGLLLAPFPLLIYFGLFALTHLPYYFARKNKSPQFELLAKDEPRLFMLVSAISKILGAPTPGAITLDDSLRVSTHYSCTPKDFFNFKVNLTGELKVNIGADLVQGLSVRDCAALIAKQMCVHAYPELGRSYYIVNEVSKSCAFWQKPRGDFQKRLRGLATKTEIDALRRLLSIIETGSGYLHAAACGYFSVAQTTLNLCTRAGNNIGLAAEQSFLGDYDSSVIAEAIDSIKFHHLKTREEMLTSERERYVNNLPEFTQYSLEKSGNKQVANKTTTASSGIVNSTAPMHSMLSQFNNYCKIITKKSYQHAGLNVDKIELCSLQTLFQQTAKDEKFSAAADDYFMGWSHPFQFWRLPVEYQQASADSSKTVNRLNNCIARIRYVAPDRKNLLHRYDKELKYLAELKAAKKMKAAGSRFEFQRTGDYASNIEQGINQHKAQLKEVQDELRQHNTLMGERLALGLSLNVQQKALCAKLHQSLVGCAGIAERAVGLVASIEELNHILRNKPKSQPQQYQLYVRELSKQINTNERAIKNRMMHCPYDFIDRRYSTMAQFVSAQQGQGDALNLSQEQLIINKAKDTLAAINWAYNQLTQRAAYIAAAMENQFAVEKVKKINKAD